VHYFALPLVRVDQPHTGIAGQSIAIRSGDQIQRGLFCLPSAFRGPWVPFVGIDSVVPKEPSRKVLQKLDSPNESKA